jgi:hypothetical protein
MNNPENYRPDKYVVSEGKKWNSWMENEAYLTNEALNKGKITLDQAQNGLTKDIEVTDMMRKLVDVNFFVEYANDVVDPNKRGQVLMDLFKKDHLAKYLSDNNFGVTIAMTRLDDKTAKTIKYLNKKKVPVTAWIVLEDEQGYWTNKTTIDETIEKTEAVRKWAKEKHLKFKAIGFDMEKPIQLKSALVQRNLKNFIKEYIKYRKQGTSVKIARKELSEYVEKLKGEKIQTEAYVNQRFVRMFLGEMSIKRNVDEYVEMDYASFLPRFFKKNAFSLILSNNTSPALGIFCKENTFPGRNLTGKPIEKEPHLTEDELESNIRTVLGFNFEKRKLNTKSIRIFALNEDGYTAKTTDRILREIIKP